jgi:putative peptidoglycan lipid II flippase
MSVMEINLFVSTSLATYLPNGTIASIYYANRFMGIPLGVFAVALSTILLPYFSKISTYAPKRLSYYLFEASKLIVWVTIPLSFLLIFFSDKIFVTLFLSKKFTIAHAHDAALLLSVFATGLFFFSLNKILLNVYYALHETRMVTFVCLGAAVTNYLVSRLLIQEWKAVGLVLAFVIAGMVQSALLAFILFKKYEINLYLARFAEFVLRILGQCFVGSLGFLVLYYSLTLVMKHIFSESIFILCTQYGGLWIWTIPLIGVYFLSLLLTRKWFGIRLAFLD